LTKYEKKGEKAKKNDKYHKIRKKNRMKIIFCKNKVIFLNKWE